MLKMQTKRASVELSGSHLKVSKSVSVDVGIGCTFSKREETTEISFKIVTLYGDSFIRRWGPVLRGLTTCLVSPAEPGWIMNRSTSTFNINWHDKGFKPTISDRRDNHLSGWYDEFLSKELPIYTLSCSHSSGCSHWEIFMLALFGLEQLLSGKCDSLSAPLCSLTVLGFSLAVSCSCLKILSSCFAFHFLSLCFFHLFSMSH